MKKILPLLLGALFCLSASAQELTVGSYNIRYKNKTDSIKGNAWEQRCPSICHQILWERLAEACLLEPLRRSLLNYFCSCYCYNYRSLQTDAARRAFRECFQKTAVPCFGIDFSDSAFFYNQSEYRELKELAEAI